MFKFSLRVQICMTTTTSCKRIISVLRFPFYADLIADGFISESAKINLNAPVFLNPSSCNAQSAPIGQQAWQNAPSVTTVCEPQKAAKPLSSPISGVESCKFWNQFDTMEVQGDESSSICKFSKNFKDH